MATKPTKTRPKPAPAPKKTIGVRIREARERAGLTQVEAAERAGLSGGYWPHLERDLKEPPIKTLVKIAAALGCSLAELLPDD